MQSVKYHTIPNDNQFKVEDSIEPQLIEVHSAHDVPTRKKRHRSGWRGGMLCGVAAASSVLILSLASIVWISRQHEISPGIHVVYQGGCSRSSDINTAVHLVMNVMSTLLLGASNYAMTVLSSPIRAEIDIWHSRKIPLEIGINSIRNISKISYQRRILWFMLVAASIPLHLIFNSAVYSATSAYTYTAALVTDQFFDGHYWTTAGLTYSLPWAGDNSVENSTIWHSWMQNAQDSKVTLQRLENEDCVKAYTSDFLTNRANLILITNSNNPNATSWNNNSLLAAYPVTYDYGGTFYRTSFYWMCATSEFPSTGELSCSSILKNPGEFEVVSWVDTDDFDTGNYYWFDVDYCLSQQVEEMCTVESSLTLCYIILVIIAVKLGCLVWTLLVLKEEPLVVPGDCVASFIDYPDTTTAGACLWPAEDFKNSSTWEGALKWAPKRRRWASAATTWQWAVCLFMCLTALTVATILLGLGISSFDQENEGFTSSMLLDTGFGSADLFFTLNTVFKSYSNSTSTLMAAAILASSPQLLITFIYFTYNSIFTSMAMALEWSQFAHIRRALRVSNPTGRQRSTYRLQLPYRYGIPLMLLITSLHWLISQSIFVVRVRIRDFEGIEDVESSIITCGYSLIATIATITVGSLAVLILVGYGIFRRYEPGMTLVGSSTAAISAACQSRSDEVADASSVELQWGVVSAHRNVEHCCFSSTHVSSLVEGKLYS